MSATSHVAHHFDDARQQRDAATMGMWLFLATEVLFIGAMFTAYAVYRWRAPVAFAEASHHLDLWLGTLNTALLLTSSLTMALGVHAAEHGDRRRLLQMLGLTIAMGLGFLVVKTFEYAAKFEHHQVPGVTFVYVGPHAAGVEMFFVLYFFMTIVHALHLVVGLGLLGWLVWPAWRGAFTHEYNTPVSMVGLYWHFVDVVWIFLFPMLYLIR